MSEIVLTDEQEEAARLCYEWWQTAKVGLNRRQIFVLAGLAGTGKTTIVKEIIRRLKVKRVQHIAPTGKAAARLRLKGNWGAKTLHWFCYFFVGEVKDDKTGDERLVFREKTSLAEGMDTPQLIVLDEASMPSERDIQALMAFGIPIIALGDHGQLEPVMAKAGIDLENGAHVKLETVMRQAAESNILRAAMFLRKGFSLPEREYEDMKVIHRKPLLREIVEFAGLDGSAQILCGLNSTRQKINENIREHLGFKGKLPMVGEKIVATFNNHTEHIMNGELFVVTRAAVESEIDPGKWTIGIKSLDDPKARETFSNFNPLCFDPADAEEEDVREAHKTAGAYDFGYALTVHKSQGSEWDRVLVVDEPPHGCNKEKWRYTACTRAAKYLEWYKYR